MKSESNEIPWKAAILTLSDSAFSGHREDTSGDVAAQLMQEAGWEIAARETLPDERQLIATTLQRFSDEGLSCVVTTGGTGLGPRDVTPEATMDVCHKFLPGMAEAMRSEGLKHTPHAMLSRQVVGVCRQTIIINLPGSPKAVKEGLMVVLPVLPHAVKLVHGDTRHD